MGICVFSLAHGSELRSSDRYLHIVEKISGIFYLNSAKVRVLGWPSPGIFFVGVGMGWVGGMGWGWVDLWSI